MAKTNKTPLKQRIARIIFETDTPAAKAFDALLLAVIILSVILVVLETIQPVARQWKYQLLIAEWCITLLFTLEYFTRLFLARHPGHYAGSFYGVIDLLAILPAYLGLLVSGPHYLMIIRALRLLRLFRIFKLSRYVRAGENIKKALFAARAKIIVFLGSTLTIMLFIGALMYLIEGPENGFHNIPIGIYWAIKTMTPVSSSDLTAETSLGRTFAAMLMILGYALAIPTGIISSELTRTSLQQKTQRTCPSCGKSTYERLAGYCKYCGANLPSLNNERN